MCKGPSNRYSQVKGVEEEDEVFALVVGQRDDLEVSIDDSGSFEVGRRFGDPQLRHRHDGTLEGENITMMTTETQA